MKGIQARHIQLMLLFLCGFEPWAFERSTGRQKGDYEREKAVGQTS